MDFYFSAPQVRELLEVLPKDSALSKHFSGQGLPNGRIRVPEEVLDDESIEYLGKYAESAGDRALRLQLTARKNAAEGGGYYSVNRLEILVDVFKEYLADDAIDGWLYQLNADGILLPWLIDSIVYVPRDDFAPALPYVSIQLLANTIESSSHAGDVTAEQLHSGMTNAILFYERDLGNISIPEMLAKKGFYKECAEFKAEYLREDQRFRDSQYYYGRQFLARNAAFLIKRKYDRLTQILEYFRIMPGTAIRCVNDEEVIERRVSVHSSKETISPDIPGKIPVHPYLYMFDLENHRNCWVHIQNLEEYPYRPELKDKLILPEDHRRLIDILTSSLDTTVEDIIEGKTGGTTILCMGAPGLGKTLTAEVYSEAVGRPLYRVHSGQLGTSAGSVEAALYGILRRAARWNAILLIDEADVYIRRRDNDLEHNAIVAEFLRTLEYFDGLLFLTTNREDDVDDAILSRCIAVIRYETPSRQSAREIWRSLASQMQVELPDDMITDLIRDFPNSSGRDIKELLKLTARMCESCNTPLTMESFHRCAIFRGK